MICEKGKEAWYYFFNYLFISSAGSLLDSKIFTMRKIGRKVGTLRRVIDGNTWQYKSLYGNMLLYLLYLSYTILNTL